MNKKIHESVWSERWRLARLSKAELQQIGLVALIVGLIFVAYQFFGNNINLKMYGRSAFAYVAGRWSDMGGDFSHGWMIPFVSLFVVWFKRSELMRAPRKVDRRGLILIVMALTAHWLGAKSEQTRISLMAFILLTWSIPFYLCGWEVAKWLVFPCGYLLFAVPMNFLESITFPLRIVATVISTSVLNGIGIAAQRSGSAIHSLAAGGFQFDVAAPCSGLRSLLAMTALTAVYAYLTQRTLVRQWLLFLSAIPLAIIGNVARITTVALVAQAMGEKLALGLYHDYSGYIVFSVSIMLMIAIGALMNTNYSEVLQRWKQQL